MTSQSALHEHYNIPRGAEQELSYAMPQSAHAVDINAMLGDTMLEQVFNLLPGSWLYIGGVCRAWMLVCKQMPTCEVEFSDSVLHALSGTCDWRSTLMSTVFESPSRFRLAAECGLASAVHKPLLQYLSGLYADVATLSSAEELGLTLGDETVRGAADAGRVTIFNYLVQERQCTVPDDAGGYTAQRGNMRMLQCLQSNEYEFTRSMCKRAAVAGQLPALQYMLTDALNCTCMSAPVADCGICFWLRHVSLCDAAESGSVEMVQWLQQQQQGVIFRGNPMHGAAGSGQIAMCAYLHSQQFPWTTEECATAAGRGHLNTLVWFFEHGCPWEADTLIPAAARGGSIAVMEFLQQQGVVTTVAQRTTMLQITGAHNHLQAAQWLRQQGAEWPDTLWYCFDWPEDIVAWARAEGCTSPLA
jgi:hypothetical protein